MVMMMVIVMVQWSTWVLQSNSFDVHCNGGGDAAVLQWCFAMILQWCCNVSK
jgi:hypothetical protein